MPRKEKKFHYIYKTTNTLTGRYYIGMHSTDVVEDGYLGSGKRLRRSVNKHGAECHSREILEFCNSRKELIDKEKEVVTLEEIAKNDCMNLMPGGRGGFISDEHQRHRSICAAKAAKKKADENPKFKKKWEEARLKGLKKAYKEGRIPNIQDHYDWSGKEHTPETIKKLRIVKKGKGIGKSNSQFNTCWINNGVDSKKVNKQTIEDFFSQGWVKGRKMKDGFKNKFKLSQEEVNKRKNLMSHIDFNKRGWVKQACEALNMKPGGVKRFVTTYIRN